MHISVLLNEVIERLNVREGGSYIDATLGSAGHSFEILRRAGEHGRLLGIDRDDAALRRSEKRLASLGGTRCLVHGNHSDIGEIAKREGFCGVDGILIDTGVSSDQLDTAERGFSFRANGPLDMRMDTSCGETAAELVAGLSEDELARIFKMYGEEPRARHIARAIVRTREIAPIVTTGELADIVAKSLGAEGRARGHHPATRVFQALRMCVNNELESLTKALEGAMETLAVGGRLAVITFESLSDRIVKQCFARHVGREISLQQGGSRWEGDLPRVAKLDKKAVKPTNSEMDANPRSRSALLRVVERR